MPPAPSVSQLLRYTEALNGQNLHNIADINDNVPIYTHSIFVPNNSCLCAVLDKHKREVDLTISGFTKWDSINSTSWTDVVEISDATGVQFLVLPRRSDTTVLAELHENLYSQSRIYWTWRGLRNSSMYRWFETPNMLIWSSKTVHMSNLFPRDCNKQQPSDLPTICNRPVWKQVTFDFVRKNYVSFL